MGPAIPNPRQGSNPVLRPLVAALALAGLAASPQSQAAPPAAHWTVTDLGTLGGGSSIGTGINAAGQATGYADTTGNAASHAFLYSNGTMTDLGTLDGSSSGGYGINDAGQVAGNSGNHAFLYSNGSLTDLGTLGGNYSSAWAINAAGQVTGSSYTPGNATQHAFLYSNGSMTDVGGQSPPGGPSWGYGINAAGQVTGSIEPIGYSVGQAFLYSKGRMNVLCCTLPLGATDSRGLAINDDGQVTGWAAIDPYGHAILYSNGTMSDLGTLGGSASLGNGINAAGQVVGGSNVTGNTAYPGAVRYAGNHAFLYSAGAMTDLNALSGVPGAGLTLTVATGINNVGQIVANGLNAAGNTRAAVLTLDTTVWEGGSSGSFSSGSGWSFLTAPNKNTRVFIDPTVSATITGPAINVDVRQLTVGGDGTGNNGIATLNLNGGTINVLGNAGQFTTVTAKGVLAGDGAINGLVSNLGTVNAVNLTLSGGLVNLGTVSGNGWLDTSLYNGAGGLLRVGAGQLLRVSGSVANSGGVEVRGGGELQFTGSFTNSSGGSVLADSATVRFNSALTNVAGGRVNLANGTAYFNGGLANNGQVQTTFGSSEVFGAVTTYSGGKVILSGNSNSTFYDAVDVKLGGELRISTGTTAVFFGQVNQRTGSLFTGAGTKFYEGGLAVGASPGLGVDGGDVSFGAGNVYVVDIGGTTACTAECATNDSLKNISFDKYVVTGHLALGGTLKLIAWNGFMAQAGQSFDLLDWGSVSGSFDSIDATGLMLADGTTLDTSQLYTSGVISVLAVQAVPEPQTWALMLAGLGIVGATRRRRIRQDDAGRGGSLREFAVSAPAPGRNAYERP